MSLIQASVNKPVKTSPGLALFAFVDQRLWRAVKTLTQRVTQKARGPCHSALDSALQHCSLVTRQSCSLLACHFHWLMVLWVKLSAIQHSHPSFSAFPPVVLAWSEAEDNSLMIHRPSWQVIIFSQWSYTLGATLELWVLWNFWNHSWSLTVCF